jgi:peptidoglycan/LPS O-acetylase OafA/YrhL
MDLQHAPPRHARLLTIVAIVISASSVALALLPHQTRPLWELGLTPAVFVCLASAAWLEHKARTTPHLRRGATALALLGGAFALGALAVSF